MMTPIRSDFVTYEGSTDHIRTPPAFSIGSGLVTCLVAIVEKCRTSSIRRRCIASLSKVNLGGVFDTKYLIAYLEAIVKHEEDATLVLNPTMHRERCASIQARDVPEAARFLEVIMSPSQHRSDFDFYKTNKVNLVYVTKNGSGIYNELQLGKVTACVTRAKDTSSAGKLIATTD